MRLGVYIRGISIAYGGSRVVAAKAKSVGLTFVPILVIWQDAGSTKFINTRQIEDYAEALHEVGVEPWIWGYPWVGKEQEFVDRIQWAKEICRGRLRGVLIDPELGYQFRSSSESKARGGAARLVSGLLNILDESTSAGTTSYGAYHLQGRFPRDEFCLGLGSPQFYTATDHEIVRGLTCWRNLFGEIVPSIPAYGPNSGVNLKQYLGKIGPVDGYIFWSWPQMGEIEWSIARDLAQDTGKKSSP